MIDQELTLPTFKIKEKIPFSSQLFDADNELREIYQKLGDPISKDPSHLYFKTTYESLIEDLTFLKDSGFERFIDLHLSQSQIEDHERNLNFTLYNFQNFIYISIVLPLKNGEKVPNLEKLWSPSLWEQREAFDNFGIVFREDYDLVRYFSRNSLSDNFKNPLANKGFSQLQNCEGTQLGELGLFYTSTQDKVEKAEVDIGRYHRGCEQVLLNTSLSGMIPLLERSFFQSSESLVTAYCRGLERLLDIEVPAKGQAIRMIFLETERITHHLRYLLNTFYLIKDDLFFNEVLSLLEGFKYARSLWTSRSSFNTPLCLGGIKEEAGNSWLSETLKFSEKLESFTTRLESFFFRDKGAHLRLKSLVTINRSDALDLCLSGPAMRACGLNHDLRKIHPFYFYNQLDLQVVLGTHGDALDRHLVHLAELKESAVMVFQLLDNLPLGRFRSEKIWSDHGRLNLPKRIDKKETYMSQEGPGGEIGVHMGYSGGDRLDFIKLYSASRPLAQAVSQVLKGCSLEELPLGVSSLGIHPAEVHK